MCLGLANTSAGLTGTSQRYVHCMKTLGAFRRNRNIRPQLDTVYTVHAECLKLTLTGHCGLAKFLEYEVINMRLGWDEYWSYYQELEPEGKRDILKRLELEKFLQHKTSKVQVEILRNAPPEIYKSLQPILKPETRVKLGLSNPELEKKLARLFR